MWEPFVRLAPTSKGLHPAACRRTAERLPSKDPGAQRGNRHPLRFTANALPGNDVNAEPSGRSGAASDKVVFFVDDDADVQRLTRKLLERAGFSVIQALTAEEAEQVAESFDDRIDVLLMDINLPDGWGAMVAQRLRAVHPEMAVVYTTGAAATDPILSGGLHDARWVLHKPFRYEELLTVVEGAMAAGDGPAD